MRFNSLTTFIKIDLGLSCEFTQSAKHYYSRLVANDLTRVELAIELDPYYFKPGQASLS